jgi:hypothetical protein
VDARNPTGVRDPGRELSLHIGERSISGGNLPRARGQADQFPIWAFGSDMRPERVNRVISLRRPGPCLRKMIFFEIGEQGRRCGPKWGVVIDDCMVRVGSVTSCRTIELSRLSKMTRDGCDSYSIRSLIGVRAILYPSLGDARVNGAASIAFA